VGAVEVAGDEVVEGVDELAVADLAAGGVVEAVVVAVEAEASGPVLVEGFGDVDLAVFEGGGLGFGDRVELEVAGAGEVGDGGGEPADAKSFEEGGGAVHGAAGRAAADADVRALGLQGEAFAAEIGAADFLDDRVLRMADDDVAFGQGSPVVDDGELGARELLDEELELGGGAFFAGGGVFGEDNAVGGLAVLGEGEFFGSEAGRNE
jgi:hypothetical protein